MNPFYDLNKKLNSIGNEQEQIAKEVAKAAEKSPVRKSLEESLKSDLKSLMEDGTGGMNFSGSGSLEEKATGDYSAKKAAAGKDIGKPGKNFSKIAKSAGEKYGSKAAGERVAGAVLNKLRHPKEEKEMEESALQAYLGDKKYGKEGMKALQQAGRDHAGKEKMAKIRSKYDKMDEADMDESIGHDIADKKEKMAQARGEKPGALKNVAKGLKAFIQGKPEPMGEADHSEEDIMDYLNRKLAPHDKQQQAKEDAVSKPFNGPADAADAYNGMWGTGMDKDLDEDTMEESVSRKHFQQVADLLKNIPDEAKRKEMALHHASIFKQQNPRFDIRRFAQAAGVDLEECAMWEELKGGQHKLDVDGDGDIGADDLAALRSGKRAVADEGWDDAMAAGRAAANQKPAFSRHDVKDTGYSKVYTRKPETFDEPDSDEVSADAPKRGRGRPATGKAAIRKTKGAYKHKADEGDEMVDEKAVSKKQQKFMGMVHAAQKGEKAASPEVAKVANGMKKKDAEDFASTKHKGLPEKVKAKKTEGAKPDFLDVDKDGDKKEPMKKAAKEKEEKVDETTTSGSVATSTATQSGAKAMGIGKGIYDSWNRQFEQLLAESVNVSQEATKMEDGNEEEAITINVTGDDVARFKEVLASMGLGQQAAPQVDVAYDDSCGTCGGTPCQCDEQLANANGATMTGDLDEADMEEGNEFSGELAKARAQHQDEFEVDGKKYQVKEADAPVDENEPDYPSNEEESDDALQYSGGLNGPKSTGQTTIPVIASQLNRQVSEASEDVDSFLNLYQSFKTK